MDDHEPYRRRYGGPAAQRTCVTQGRGGAGGVTTTPAAPIMIGAAGDTRAGGMLTSSSGYPIAWS
jgi:hypothetical protein